MFRVYMFNKEDLSKVNRGLSFYMLATSNLFLGLKEGENILKSTMEF